MLGGYQTKATRSQSLRKTVHRRYLAEKSPALAVSIILKLGVLDFESNDKIVARLRAERTANLCRVNAQRCE